MLDPKNLKPDQEQWEEFYSKTSDNWYIQYDYRNKYGCLFSTIAKTLESARNKRNKWLEGQR